MDDNLMQNNTDITPNFKIKKRNFLLIPKSTFLFFLVRDSQNILRAM